LQLSGQALLVESPDSVEFDRDEHIYTRRGVILPSITQVLAAEGIIDTSFYTEGGRDRGKNVHLACHLFDTGQIGEEEIDAETEPYLRAWISFKRDTGFEVVDSEKPLASKLYGFAGTPDRVGKFETKSIYASPKRLAVELHNDGSYKLFPFNDPSDFSMFLSILAVHNWKKGGK
jgi:hypothetical protein